MTSSNWLKFRNLSSLLPLGRRLFSRTLVSRLYLVFVTAAILFSATRHQQVVLSVMEQLDGSVLLASYAFCLLALLLQAATWQQIQQTLAPGLSIPLREWLFAYVYGYLGRYVPGKVAMLVGRTLLLGRHGYSKRSVVGAAVIENAVFFFGTGVLTAMCLPTIIRSLTNYEVPLAENSMLFVLLVFSVLVFFQWSLHFSLKMVGRFASVPKSSFAFTASVRIFTLAIAYQLVNGLAFSFLIVPFAPGDGFPLAIFLQVSAALSLGIGLGILALIAPGGIGVREVVLTALLSGVIDAHSAYILPLVLRFVMLVAEVTLCGMSAGYCRLRKRGGPVLSELSSS